MTDDTRRVSQGRGFALDPLDIIDPVQWQGVPVPKRRWLWDGWIPMHGVTALYGDGGTGKSLLALQLAVACATGRPFLGAIVQRCKVLAVFCEDDRDELQRRLASIVQTHDIDFADLGDLHLMSRVGRENLLMTFRADAQGEPTAFHAQVVDQAKALGAQLVIADTAADLFGGNENIRPQVRQFMSQLTRIAIDIDGAVLLLAHPSQTGKATGSGDGGSTAWSNSARARIYLDRERKDNGDVPDRDGRILTRMKANYASAGDVMRLRWENGAFVGEYEAGAPAGGRDQVVRNRTVDEAFMAGLKELDGKSLRVNSHKGQANYAPKELRAKTDICADVSEAELTDAMNRLIRANRVSVIEEGPESRRRSRLVIVAPDLPGTR